MENPDRSRKGLDYDDPNSKILNERNYLWYLLKNGIEFPDVKPIKSAEIPNSCPNSKVGAFKHDSQRKLATTDVKMLERFTNPGVDPIVRPRSGEVPSFRVAGPREMLVNDPTKLRVAVVNAGGVAPGLNCVINAIVNRHVNVYGLEGHDRGQGVYGIQESFLGACNYDDFCTKLDPAYTENWLDRGGSMLGMRRYDPNPNEPNRKLRLELLAKEIAKEIEGRLDILYVIGGNGSLSVAHEIGKIVQNVQIVGVPKTMDNDIFWVSESFGHKTAVENTARLINTLNDEAESTRRIFLLEVFGAESGFVAASSALASGHVDLVLIPEDFDGLSKVEAEKVLSDYMQHLYKQISKGTSYANVVLAEGTAKLLERAQVELDELTKDGSLIRVKAKQLNDDGEPIFLSQFKRHILAQKWEIPIGNMGSRKSPVDVFFNRPQHYIRATAANSNDQIFCDQLGAMAVDCALAGYTNFMISEWHNNFVMVPLELVADRTKRIAPNGLFWKQVINNTRQPTNEYHAEKF